MITFFQQNLALYASYFCSPVGTCMSLSYLSANPPPMFSNVWGHICDTCNIDDIL